MPSTQVRQTDTDDFFMVVTDDPEVIRDLGGNSDAELVDQTADVLSFKVAGNLVDYLDLGGGD